MSQPPPLPPPVIPYASGVQFAQAAANVWREGNKLVVPRAWALPARCVKCNAPADPRYTLDKTLYWHHPLIYLLILPGVLIYAIVAIILRKSARVQIGLCTFHGHRRRMRILIGWLMALFGIGLIIASIALSSNPFISRNGLEWI